MEIAKALIVTRTGGSTAGWPSTPREDRHLFPIANQPIIHHHLHGLRAAGLLEATILADGPTRAAIHEVVGDGREFGLNVSYLDDVVPADLGAALAAAGAFIRDEPVLVQGAGALVEPMQTYISAFAREQLDALALELSGPAAPGAEAAPAGLLLSPRAVSTLAGGTARSNPLAGIQAVGGRVRVQEVDGWRPSGSDVDALLDGNRRVLAGLRHDVDAATLDRCTIQGTARIHPTAQLTRTIVRGPAVIGPGARITDSYIGPYTAIGEGVQMEGAEIEHSIVLAEAELRFVGTRIESSLIGIGARVVRDFSMPSTMRVCLGERAEIVLR